MLKKLISKASRFAGDAVKISNRSEWPYTFAERVNLLRARLSTSSEPRVLNYRVRYLSRSSFRIALGEIFFKGDYRFTAKTDAPVILDCGANIGLATLFFKHFYPKARITAFEADPDTASALKANIANNHLQDVEAHNLMLANGEGARSFYASTDPQGNLMGSANPERLADHREVIVQAARLSRFISGPVDLLKLDVEGSEFDVLEDLIASGAIAQIQSMVIEYHHKIGAAPSRLASFLGMLEGHGFEYQLSAGGCNPITAQNVCQDIVIGAYRPSAA